MSGCTKRPGTRLFRESERMLRKFVTCLLLAPLVTGCAQKTVFISEPAGAQVFVDGKEVGVTPCKYEYRASNGSTYELTIQKEGFAPISRTIEADEVDDVSLKQWLTAGLIWTPLWIGSFFTKKLKDSYHFVMDGLASLFQIHPQFAENQVENLPLQECYLECGKSPETFHN